MNPDPSYQNAYNQAVRYLTIRPHTVGELQDKLRAKKYPAAVILEVVRRLEELDFLNDERYAQLFVESTKQHGNYGYYGLKARLMKKRIPTDIIEAVLEEFFTVENELAVAQRLVGKLQRYRKTSYEQAAARLSARGFRSDVIHETLAGVTKAAS